MDPKLRFSCVSFCLDAFGTIMLLHKLDAKRAKLVQLMQKFVQRGLARIFATSAPDPHHWTLNSCFRAFFLFGCIWNRYAIARNLLQNAPNWTQNSCFRAFLFHLGAFRTVSLLHETCCIMRQTGAINAKVRATKSCRNFS